MGAKEKYPDPLYIIIACLGISLISITTVFILAATQNLWLPFVADAASTLTANVNGLTNKQIPIQPSVETSNPAEDWKWLKMKDHNILVYVPVEWTMSSEILGSVPGEPPCTDYTLSSPDGNGIVTVKTYCGGFGFADLWNPCGSNPQYIDHERNAVRFQDGDYTFEYTTGALVNSGDKKTLMCSWGWLELPWIFEIHYTQLNGQFDFGTVEKMLLSMYSTE